MISNISPTGAVTGTGAKPKSRPPAAAKVEVVGTERVFNKTAGGWTVYVLRVTSRRDAQVWLIKHRYSAFVRLANRLVTAGAGNSLPLCWAALEAESQRNLVQLLYSTERARRSRCQLIARCFRSAAAVDSGFTEHALVRRFLRPPPPSPEIIPGGTAGDVAADWPESAELASSGQSEAAAVVATDTGVAGSAGWTRSGRLAAGGGGSSLLHQQVSLSVVEDPESMWRRVSGVAASAVTAADWQGSAKLASTGQSEDAACAGTRLRLLLDYPPPRSVVDTLREQEGCCAGCGTPLDGGSGSGAGLVSKGAAILRAAVGSGARRCEYSGGLYCPRCQPGDAAAVLPAAVAHDWDFSSHKVCAAARSYLETIQGAPVMCLGAVNPAVYTRVPLLASVRERRHKLAKLVPELRAFEEGRALLRSVGPHAYLLEGSEYYAMRCGGCPKQTLQSQTLRP